MNRIHASTARHAARVSKLSEICLREQKYDMPNIISRCKEIFPWISEKSASTYAKEVHELINKNPQTVTVQHKPIFVKASELLP